MSAEGAQTNRYTLENLVTHRSKRFWGHVIARPYVHPYANTLLNMKEPYHNRSYIFQYWTPMLWLIDTCQNTTLTNIT